MLMHGRPVSVIAFLFLLGFTSAALAQQKDPPPVGETIEVSIINVDVFVTDKQGNRVHGLTSDDFEIRENGKSQPITNFAEYAPDDLLDGTLTVDGKPVTDTASAVSAAPPSKRTIVILVEVDPQPSARVKEVFASLRDFVSKAVRPGDAATVVAFDTRLGTRQEFTDDRDALMAALSTLEKESIGVARKDAAGAVRRAQADDDATAAAIAQLAGGEVKGEPVSTAGLERMAAELFELVDMRRKTAAMTSIMESMSGVEGKKIMVMALYNYGLRPGFRSFAETTHPNFPMDLRVEKLRQAVMRTANANGVTLYPIHPAGIQWTNQPDAQEERPTLDMNAENDLWRAGADNAILANQTASLSEIARETGGLMAAGPSDIVDLLPRVVDDLESYYSLAYRVTPTGKDARRKVDVTVRNGDYRVRSRRSVVEKSDDTQMEDLVVANLFQPLEHSVIPIRVELGAMTKVKKNLWSVPVVVRVPIGSLTTQRRDAAATGAFSVFVGTGGDFGVISDVKHRTQPYSINLAELDFARASHFTYNVTVEVDRFADAVSVGVRDNISKEYGIVRLPLPGRGKARELRGGSSE
jgi:VWFA-related protein